MNEHLISDLNRFVDDSAVTMSETPGHVELTIARSDVSLSLIIPKVVLEWWVEVSDSSGGNKVVDWCDYAGYNDSTEQALSEDMRADVLRFIENVLARPLRLVENGRILQWHAGGEWFQAVPLTQDVEQALRGHSR